MSHIDHLVSFPSEAAALAAFEGTAFVQEGAWNGAVCFPGLRLYTQLPVFNEAGELITPPSFFPGFWVLIATEGDAPDPVIAAMEACRMAAHRERALGGLSFIFAGESLRAAPEQIASIERIDGLPAGSAYPLQNPQVMA